jgi:S-adenosylmethionine hydrolase
VHRVIEQRAPGTTVIDLTHGIAAHDIRAGALALWRAAPWLAPGVILGVVDPGVGTSRRGVAIEVADAGAALVGPDNGLLLPAALRLGSISRVVELQAVPPRGLGITFAGRDVFAPAAAALAAGEEIGRLGAEVDPASLAGDEVPPAVPEPDGWVRCQVLWIDRFGNAQLNTDPSTADPLGPTIRLEAATGTWLARRAETYGELAPTELGVVVDSAGLLSLALNQGSAAALTGLRPGDTVRLATGD